jgi:hypothetical protein
VTCPWADTHTSDKNNGAVVWEGEGFCCKHSHCIQKTFKELLTALGVQDATPIEKAEDALIRSRKAMLEGKKPTSRDIKRMQLTKDLK